MMFESFVFRAAFWFIGLVAIWTVLRGFDHLSGNNFKEKILPNILSHPIGAAVYYGLRFFAVCVYTGLSWQF